MNLKEWKEQFIKYLQEKITHNQASYKEFEDAVRVYQTLSFELEKILEYASRSSEVKEKDKFWKLYKDFSLTNIGEVQENLNKLGYAIREDKSYNKVVEALHNQAYRIMEKTRHSLRSEVQYMLYRIFVVNAKPIPPLLSRAFNPVYPDEIFKIFIYSFLGGMLGKEETIKKGLDAEKGGVE